MYVDIHTHGQCHGEGKVCIRSLYDGFSRVKDERYVSIGLHPWYLEDAEVQMDELRRYAGENNVLAIGECGLDKVCSTSWELQMHFFRLQVLLSKGIRKPLIIHCVRSFNEVLHELKKVAGLPPVIMHGFSNRWTIAEQVIARGYYLSFGAAILRKGSIAREVISQVPGNLLFLETDDMEVDIREIYAEAAFLRQTTEEALILQVQENFRTAFNI